MSGESYPICSVMSDASVSPTDRNVEICLSCPLDDCELDNPGENRGLYNRRSMNEIRKLHHEGVHVKELATMFNKSRKTIQRYIK
ncbi:hypothetical protein LCGC14_0383170 [marine sediment metagenome]|uniref:Resolvase HTH domain-containing protein n=1 Tax=marine sediment metagenome TaxID=412755 RepID=A0A0F9WAJ5_9ZZZZ